MEIVMHKIILLGTASLVLALGAVNANAQPAQPGASTFALIDQPSASPPLIEGRATDVGNVDPYQSPRYFPPRSSPYSLLYHPSAPTTLIGEGRATDTLSSVAGPSPRYFPAKWSPYSLFYYPSAPAGR
jgi:hypothetical protein